MLADRIGRCVSVARRSGMEWFVGTINPGGGEVRVSFSFLEEGVPCVATLYSDRDADGPAPGSVKVETIAVDRTTVLEPRIPANGGLAVRIVRGAGPVRKAGGGRTDPGASTAPSLTPGCCTAGPI